MPTVFIEGKYRFYFFSREETRKHIHVSTSDGEMKVWLEPEVSIAKVINLNNSEITQVLDLINARRAEIDEYWNKHFN